MQLISDIQRDARHRKILPGSYEWWYFDGISEEGDYQVVIIFFDGYPFSPRYIQSVEADPDAESSLPDRHPAISISIYCKGRPVFYSLAQYPPDVCHFDEKKPVGTIGENSFRFSKQVKHGIHDYAGYDLRINEKLPSGEELKGIITFIAMNPNTGLFGGAKESGPGQQAGERQAGRQQEHHAGEYLWNLVLPRAGMQCRINFIRKGLIKQELKFEGIGYHDHIVGYGPMRQAFQDCYRGWVHFPQATLVYNIMNNKNGRDYQAWLISTDNRRQLYSLDLERGFGRRMNRYFLYPDRRLLFRDGELKLDVRHRKPADSGPVYCRYLSEARMTHPAIGTATAQGIAEYIRPNRIHCRLFHPLVHMRMRHVDQ